MSSLILVDLASIWYRQWHASADEAIGSAFSKTLEFVRGAVSNYDYSAICLDAPPYERKKLFDGYKIQRDKPEAQMLEQYRRVKERLAADGMHLWSVQGHESDDVIGTAIAKYVAGGLQGVDTVRILSADKDLMCCVSDEYGITQQSPATGQVYDEAAVIAKFGVHPKDMPDFLALVGDASDGIPGVKGVGPKTAAQLLATWGSLQEIERNVDKLEKPKLMENMFEGRAMLKIARQLVTLQTDLPIQLEDVFKKREQKPLVTPTEVTEEQEQMTDDEAEGLISGPNAAQKKEEPSQPAQAAPEQQKEASAPKEVDAPKKALAVVPPQPGDWSLALEPNSRVAAWWVAETLYNSRIYSRFPSAAAIYAVISRGRALGLDATLSLDAFHLIEGKPAMHADLIEALVIRSGKAEYWDCVETTREKAVYETKRKGARFPLRIEFTIEDAWRLGVVEKDGNGYRGRTQSGKPSNWDKVRATMLRHRCKTQLARAVYPDVTLGLYTPDELGDEGKVLDAEFEE